MKQARSRAHRKIYRLALYGVKSSGKTCILTALAMTRETNLRKFTCSWIEETPDHPLPSRDPSVWKTTDPYHLGWRWLSEQKERLTRGELPPPNPNSQEPACFLFDFSSPDRGTVRVELVDYSGELITLTLSELAAKLRSHMETCDGILVLAEVPHPGRDLALLAQDLERVKGAFSLLLSERDQAAKHNWPVALLLNKWDRRGPIAFADPDRESERAQAFITEEPEPPQRGLVHAIENAVAPENLKLFPVSAFGGHTILADGREVPANSGGFALRSFGLEDPFVWIISRRDEIDVATYEQAANTPWWRFQELFEGRQALREGDSLKSRFPVGSDLARRAAAAQRRSTWKRGSQFASLFVVAVLILMGTEAILDRVRYRSVISNQEKPDATTESLLADEEWLRAYYNAPGFRHFGARFFGLTREIALKNLEESQDRRDNRSWEIVLKQPEGETQVELVRTHQKDIGTNCPHKSKIDEILTKYKTSQLKERDNRSWEIVLKQPEGETQVELAKKHREEIGTTCPHKPEIDELIAKNDTRHRQQENQNFLADLEREVKAIGPPHLLTGTEIGKLQAKLTALPHPELLDTEGKTLRDGIKAELDKLNTMKEGKEWAEFQGVFFELLNQFKVVEAAARLRGARDEFPKEEGPIKDLEKKFATRAVDVIKERRKNATKSKLWRDARDAVEKPRNNPVVVSFLDAEQIRELDALLVEIDDAEDHDLYEQIRTNKPQCRDQIAQYRKLSRTGRMSKQVDEYQTYLDQINGKLELKLVLSQIEWGDAWEGYTHRVTVTVNGTTLIEDHATATKFGRTGKLGKPAALSMKLEEEIKIDVTLVRNGSYNPFRWYPLNVGSGKYTGKVQDLNGKTLELQTTDHMNKASFKIEGIPIEPPLPAWGKE